MNKDREFKSLTDKVGDMGYHYSECGLDNVFLKNGYEIVESKYGDAIKIEDREGLHKVIGMDLASKNSKLDSREFRYLRIELDLSQDSLGKLFGVNESTVRNWEKERTSIPDGADALIRMLYSEKCRGNITLTETLERLCKAQNALTEQIVIGKTRKGWSVKDAA